MSWQIFLLINLISATVRETLNKKIVSIVDPVVSLFYINLFCTFFLYAIYLLLYKTLPRYDPLIIGTGVLFVVGFTAYFTALRFSLSQTILFQSYSILVAMALAALFLGEARYFDYRTLTGFKVVGGTLLAFVSLWYLLHTGSKKEEWHQLRWFYAITVVILFYGIGSFTSAFFIQKYSSLELLINQNNGILPLFFLLLVYQKKPLVIPKKQALYIVSNSVISIIAVLSFFEALKMTSVARLFPLQQTALVILTMLSGVIIFKEGGLFHGKKLVGMMLGLVGMILLITS